jgi:predicted dehydrogenase
MRRSSLRIAIIGCGAVVERHHLPAFAALGIKPRLLVDINASRLSDLAQKFQVASVSDEYTTRLGEFDAAIVASPHCLHAPICCDLLRRGVHVLVEKPMALTHAECQSMIEAASEGKATLAVGLMRRFFGISQWVKAALAAEVLGPIERFDVQEGVVYDWPVTSGFFFNRETAGGGVLIDTGAHTIDLLQWWVGDLFVEKYYDDNYGGVEADCRIEFTLAAGGCGTVELSRTRKLRNSAIFRGPLGEMEVWLHQHKITATPAWILQSVHNGFSAHRVPRQLFRTLFTAQLEDWFRAIETGQPPFVSGVEAARSMAIIDACYRRRQLLELPWMSPVSSRRDSVAVTEA